MERLNPGHPAHGSLPAFLKWPLLFLVLSGGICLFSLIGDWFVGTTTGLASPILPAAGFSLAAALVFGPVPGLAATFAGDFLAGSMASRSGTAIFFGALVPTIEAAAGWAMARRVFHADPALPSLRHFVRFVLAACLAGPLFRAAVAVLQAPSVSDPIEALGYAIGAWQAAALGGLIFGPFFLFVFQRQDLRPQSRQGTYELLLYATVLGGILYLLMTSRVLPGPVFVFLLAVCLVLSILVAARMGLRPTALFLATFVFLVPAFVAMFPEQTGALHALHFAGKQLGMSGAVAFLAALGCLLLAAFRDELVALRMRFTLAMASADLCFWDWSENGWRCYTPSWKEKFGLPGHRYLDDEAWLGIIHPADRSRVEQSLDAFRSQPSGVWECEYRVHSPDRAWHLVSSRASLLRRTADDRVAVVVGITRDITNERAATESQIAAVQADAELRELRSQLNPHFLLNALNSVAAMLGRRNDLAREMIICLGGFLRHLLSGANRKPTTLGDELDLVRDYLRIEGIRFEERLRWRIDADDGLLGARVPSMLVLTLVENAVKHGIARLERGGAIEVSVGRTGDLLEISVVNDGPLGRASGGLGIENCRRRIELATGGRGTLHLNEEPGPRVRAAAILPIQTDTPTNT